jgi:N-methylhydantoinase B
MKSAPLKKPAPRALRRMPGAAAGRKDGLRSKRPQAADAVLTEIVRNGVLAVTEEMKIKLTRTAYNPIIYEALDFTVGLYTAEGETVSIGLGLPSFIRGMANTIRAEIDHFGRDGLEPGDILVTNDAYVTGSHLYHFTFTKPVFHGGQLSGFVCTMAHWTEVGGVLGGITTDIYSEGLQVPIMKYQKAGIVNQDLVDIIRMNVRIPDKAMGDLRAQITALKAGERRFVELLERYGRGPVLSAISNIMDISEAAARARTRTIPDGVYEAQSYMDDDGVDIGRRVPIKVKVIKQGDEMTIDLSEIGSQLRGFYNSGPSTGMGCAQVAYKCLTSPTDYPVNEGSLRPLKVVLGSGTVVTAVRPAAMRVWMTVPMTVVDTIFKAMEKAVPKQTIAGHFADLLSAQLSGISPRDGRLFIGGAGGPMGGGWGAKHNEDGMCATVCLNDGDTHNAPCEQTEAKFPVLIERHALRQDSGGAGRFRGGLGVEKVVQARAALTLNTHMERVHCRPWGLAGGLAGAGNSVTLRIDGQEQDELPNGKVFSKRLKPGDAFTLLSGGGGGFGRPQERDPQRVAHDVHQGYVSREAAKELYGVAVTDEGTADRERTRLMRLG